MFSPSKIILESIGNFFIWFLVEDGIYLCYDILIYLIIFIIIIELIYYFIKKEWWLG